MVSDQLVADLEPGGVWGPGLVARQLASASLVRPGAGCSVLVGCMWGRPRSVTAYVHPAGAPEPSGCQTQTTILSPPTITRLIHS